MYLCVKFVDATDGQIPLDARVIVRWNTRDTAVKGGRRDEVGSWDFELTNVNMRMISELMSGDMIEPGALKSWPELLHCWCEEGMWNDSILYMVV